MRAELKKIYHTGSRSDRFYATVDKVLADGRIILRNLRNKNLALIADHFWTGERYWFSDVKPVEGLEVSFIADIGFYHRRDGSFDFKPKDLREIVSMPSNRANMRPD